MVGQAAPITLEKAKENAMAFLTSGNMQRVKGNRTLTLAYTRNDAKGVKAPLFHVFNIADGNGFVIASADDVALPVLGYCDNGVFDLYDILVNIQAWLDGYGEEISKARENGVVPRGDAPVYASRQKINPMIKSTWDQYAPYNDMCVFDGTRCVTGCAATAMAQIIYYWAKTGIEGKKFRCGSTALPAYTTDTQEYSVGEHHRHHPPRQSHFRHMMKTMRPSESLKSTTNCSSQSWQGLLEPSQPPHWSQGSTGLTIKSL